MPGHITLNRLDASGSRKRPEKLWLRGPRFPDPLVTITGDAQAASLHIRARPSWIEREIPGNRDLAEPISRIRDRHRRSRVHLGLPQDRLAGFRRDRPALHAG